MLFLQQYHIDESGFGRQTIQFAVSDNYDELFDTEAVYTEVDIFSLENIKQDLNTEDGKFAIDELELTVNQAVCQTVNQKNALYFCLDATAVNINRYVALWFGERETHNLRFVGKITSNISANDLFWNSQNYKENHKPLREYKFKCLIFDVSVLQQALLNGDVYDVNNNKIENVHERFLDVANETWIHQNNTFKPMYREWTGIPEFVLNKYVHLRPTVNLYKYLNKLLELASELLEEKINSEITFELIESDLGFDVLPAYIEQRNTHYTNEKMLTFPKEGWQPKLRKLRLKLSEAETETSSPVFVSTLMTDPRLYYNNYEIANDKITFHRQALDGELSLSFLNSKNVAELLFDLARSFGCFITFEYNNTNSISLKFVSRQSIVSGELVYLSAPDSAKIDVSSNANNGIENYYTQGGTFYDAGIDNVINGYHTKGREVIKTEAYENAEMKRVINKDSKKIESKRLLLSISPTISLLQYNITPWKDFYPFNSIIVPSVKEQWVQDSDMLDMYRLNGDKSLRNAYYLSTALYVRTTPLQVMTVPPQFIDKVISPVMNLCVKMQGKDKTYSRLEDYINDVMLTTEQYYKSEYEISVPFWNGFSDNENGTGNSWKKLKIGKKIKLTESVIRYIDAEFTNIDITKEYIVTGIEVSLKEPKTKIKLINAENFAFGYSEEIEPSVTPPYFDEEIENTNGLLPGITEGYTVETGDILAGEVVMILANGKVMKAVNHSDNYYLPVGIALKDGTAGTKISVQFSGRVSGYYSFSSAGRLLQLRKSNGLNISETFLLDKTAEEDMIVLLGMTDSIGSFILDVQKMVIE